MFSPNSSLGLATVCKTELLLSREKGGRMECTQTFIVENEIIIT